MLTFHLPATHHSYETDKTSVYNTIPVDQEVLMAQNIVDGPCLIPNIEKFIEQTWEIEYE